MSKTAFLLKLKKAAPIILSALSGVGVVATAILSSKATVKALCVLEQHEINEKEELEPTEKIKTVWKCYIPVAVVALATIGCIVGNGVLNRKQQASLVGACALISSRFKQYQEKVKELYGEEAHKKVICSMMVQRAKDPDIIVPGVYGPPTSLDWDGDDEEVKHLFYESYSGTYFTSSISRVLQAEIHLNRNITLGKFVTFNDFFRFLGLEEITGGDEIGWALCDGYTFVDFNHYREKPVMALEGFEDLVAYVIEPEFYPSTEECLL